MRRRHVLLAGLDAEDVMTGCEQTRKVMLLRACGLLLLCVRLLHLMWHCK